MAYRKIAEIAILVFEVGLLIFKSEKKLSTLLKGKTKEKE